MLQTRSLCVCLSHRVRPVRITTAVGERFVLAREDRGTASWALASLMVYNIRCHVCQCETLLLKQSGLACMCGSIGGSVYSNLHPL